MSSMKVACGSHELFLPISQHAYMVQELFYQWSILVQAVPLYLFHSLINLSLCLAFVFLFLYQGLFVCLFKIILTQIFLSVLGTHWSPRGSGYKHMRVDNILERAANGSLIIWDKVGLVMPITTEPTEPTEPAMGHEEWFMNLWIKDYPSHLDYITDFPHYIP